MDADKDAPYRSTDPSAEGTPQEEAWHDLHDLDPNHLLDGLIARLCLENDAALASRLHVIPPIIRMLRSGSLSMTPSVLMRWIANATNIAPAELLALVRPRQGDRQARPEQGR